MRLSLLPLLLLAACHAEKPDWAKQGQQTAVPAALCQEIEKGVAQLRKSSAVDITDKGEATMPSMLWNGMTGEQHDQMLRTLAFHAACKAGVQADAQPVSVHGDDGTPLVSRSISTRVDASEALRDEDR